MQILKIIKMNLSVTIVKTDQMKTLIINSTRKVYKKQVSLEMKIHGLRLNNLQKLNHIKILLII